MAASFDPQSLTGTQDVSTLSIAVDPTAEETEIILEVAAHAGELAASEPLQLELVSLTIVGRVEDVYGQPLGGGRAGSQGQVAHVGPDGTFTLEGLAVPYDLMLGSRLDRRFHRFEGLTDPDPVLVPYGVLWEPVGLASAIVEGSLLGGDPLAPNERVIVCAEGRDLVIYDCAAENAGADYEFQPVWYDIADQQATLHAFHYEVDANSETVAFHGYDRLEVNLVNGELVTWDIEFEPVDTARLRGQIVRGSGTAPDSLLAFGFVSFGENLTMLVNGVYDEAGFDLLMPEPPGATLGTGPYGVVVADGHGEPEGSMAWRPGLDEEAGTLSLLDVPRVSGPANGQSGVSFNTPFAVSGLEGRVKTFTWTGSNGPGPLIALTTTRDEVTIPDPAILGFGGLLTPYRSMFWAVSNSVHRDTDRATTELHERAELQKLFDGYGSTPGEELFYATASGLQFGFGTPP